MREWLSQQDWPGIRDTPGQEARYPRRLEGRCHRSSQQLQGAACTSPERRSNCRQAYRRNGHRHLFTAKRSELAQQLLKLRSAIRPDAAIWVSWPKKAAKLPTDVTEDVIREIALPLDFVDVKVCAVDDRWSGLKLVIRKARRTSER